MNTVMSIFSWLNRQLLKMEWLYENGREPGCQYFWPGHVH